MKITTKEERVVVTHADYRREFNGGGPFEVTEEEFRAHLESTGFFRVAPASKEDN